MYQDQDQDLTKSTVEETPDYTMTLEPEPAPLEEDLKQKLVS
jgi:hypothetical protein